MKHILSCSFGKDSIATALLALQHGEPLDELVYCEVMFSEKISGELPEHSRFMNSFKVCSMQALRDGCDIVGGSTDEHGGWLLRPGYREMMQQVKVGNVDCIYICRMRQVSGKERHLYSFFRRLMQHGVQITATEYSLRDRVNMFRLARRVERYATRKGLRLPW